MNRIFNNVWNEVTRTYVAVAESVKRRGKSAGGSCVEGARVSGAPAQRRRHRARPMPMALEQRFMFDGAAVVDAAHALPDAGAKALIPVAPAPVEVRAADPAKDNGKKEVVFVDTSVADYKTLEAGIRDGVGIVEIGGNQDGLAQMAKWAETHTGYDAIHILSHGSEGALHLGTNLVTDATLTSAVAQAELAEIGHALNVGGDLLVYGCNVAAGADGAKFVADLAADTGADVAASTDATGAVIRDGNWVLEKNTGDINVTALSYSDRAYSDILQAITKSVLGDGNEITQVGIRDNANNGTINTFDGFTMTTNSGTTGYMQVGSAKISVGQNYSGVQQGTVVTSVSFSRTDGSSFAFYGFDKEGLMGGATTATYQLTGYRGGSAVTSAVTYTVGTGSNNISFPTLDWKNVDKVVVTGTDIQGWFSNFTWGATPYNITLGSSSGASALSAGDIRVVGFNSTTGGTDTYALVTLKDIPSGTTLFITDTGIDPATSALFPSFGALPTSTAMDGVLVWTTTQAVSAGTVLRSSTLASYGTVQGDAPVLTTAGDQIIVYQQASLAGAKTYISAFDSNKAATSANGWATAVTSANTANSGVPSGLSAVTTTGGAGDAFGLLASTASFRNAKYTGATTVGTVSELITAINTVSNWSTNTGVGATVYDLSTLAFTISGAGPTVTSATYDASTNALTVTGTGMTTGDSIDTTKLTFTGQGGSTYTLAGSYTVTASSATSFSVTLNNTDQAAVETLLNKNGTTSLTGSTTYNLAAATGWDVTQSAAADTTGNGVTVSSANPNAVFDYEAATGTITGFDASVGSHTVTQVNTAAGETLQADSVNDNMAGAAVSGSTPVTGSETLYASANYFGESSVTFKLTDGKKFDLTSINFQEYMAQAEVVTLTSSKGSVTYSLAAGTATPVTALFNVSAATNAAYMQGITSFTVTALTGTPGFGGTNAALFGIGFDNISLANILATGPTTTISGIHISADTGSSATDFITKTAAQTITGTLSAGLAAGEILYGSVDGGSTWTNVTAKVTGTAISWDAATLSGSSSIKFKVTDASANDGTIASQAYVLDTTNPSEAISSTITTNTGAAGTISSGGLTKDNTLALSGTYSDANGVSSVQIYDGATLLGSATLNAGNWSYTTGALSDAAHSFTAVATDAAGNTFTTSAVTATVDTTAPTTTVATKAFSADTGTSSTDFITNTAAQTISGTLSANLAAGEIVEVSLDNGSTWATATTTVGQNTWSLAGQTLTASNTLQVRVTDAAGNSGTASTQAYVLDTAAPTNTIATKAFSADTGTSSTDFITKTAAQTISGTLSANLAAGEIVEVSLDNGATWTTATTTVGANTWSLAGQTLTASNTLKVRVSDTAGNNGTAIAQAYVLDTVAPTNTIATKAFSADTGTNTTDFITSTSAQTISGTLGANLAAGEFVEVSKDNGTTWTTATATVGANTWSLAGQTLTGSNTLQVRVSDTAGNTGTAATQAYVLDTAAPAISTAAINGTSLVLTYTEAGSGIDSSSTLQTAEYVVNVGGTPVTVNSVAIDAATKTVTLTLAAAVLSTDTVTVSYTANGTPAQELQDVAGNLAANLVNQAVTNNTGAGPTTTVATAALSADTGTSSTDFITNTAAQTVSGTLSAALAAGESVQVSYDNGATWTNATSFTVGSTAWSTATTLTGSSTFQARVTNAGGSSTAYTHTYTLDTVAPTNTIVTKAFSADTGTNTTDFITSTAAQTISGTLGANLAAGEFVEVSKDNGTTWTTATATVGANTWSLAGQTLTASNTLQVRVTDAAGNHGAASTQAYVLDTAAPAIGTAAINGTSLVLTYTETGTGLDASTALQTGEYVVMVNGSAATVTGVVLDPATKTVTLTLGTAVKSTDVVTVSYTANGTATQELQDLAGNLAADFSNQVVANNTAPATPTPPPPPAITPTPPLPEPTPKETPTVVTPPSPQPSTTSAFLPPASGLGNPTIVTITTPPTTLQGAPGPDTAGATRPVGDSSGQPTRTLTQGDTQSAFRVVVLSGQQGAANDGLMLNRGMTDQVIQSSGKTEISIPPDAFAHTDPNSVIHLTSQQTNGQPLPNWVRFDARSGKFSVQAPAGVTGELSIKVIARDTQGHEVATIFKIRVGSKSSQAPQASLDHSGRTGLSEQVRAAARQAANQDRIAKLARAAQGLMA
ncbi:MAG TPA: DUF4347 domain-containing protein [Rhodocyclaceae bacterium]|nr:DUF4347 domain-containing protein [Rhodocyclaceae bacterium]